MAARKSSIPNWLRILLPILVYCLQTCLPVSAKDFTVSIYQPRMTSTSVTPNTRQDAVAHMIGHIEEFEVQARKAAERGTQILVFPEYGLYADIEKVSRTSVKYLLETIPDPKVNSSWTPCDLPNTDEIIIQRRFSCMAKENELYIVANVGEIESCDRSLFTSCPWDGRYQFNTNVVYDPNGTLVSRYRKKHLFGEPHFNEPKVAEHQVFDTPFGRFASIVCFDIYFQDTLQDLIENRGVRNIIFPNMWFSIPPFFASTAFHASVAWATKINLISANLILDEPQIPVAFRKGGSGFYDGVSGDFTYSYEAGLITKNMTHINPDAPFRFAMAPKRETPGPGDHKVTTYSPADIAFKFKLIELSDKEGSVGVCHYGFCCGLDYEFESNSHVTYFLGASYFYEFQGCLVYRKNDGIYKFGAIPDDTNVPYANFKRIRLYANEFKTPFVFPQVVVMEPTAYKVLNPSHYYKDGEISINGTTKLHSMVLLDRIYPSRPSSASHLIISVVLLIGTLVLSLLYVRRSD